MSDPEARLSIWVVMPTYNGAAHLHDQLRSIADQHRLPDGLIASDDRSTDETFSILEEFARSVPFPVRLVRQESNRGLLDNLESALEQIIDTADVIAFADQDDVWAPDKLAVLEEAFGDESTLLWFSDADFIDGQGQPYGSRLWQSVTVAEHDDLNEAQHLPRFIVGQTIFGTAMAARCSLVRAGLPFPRTRELDGHAHFLHDGWLGLIAHLRHGVALEPRTLTHYRQHDRQFTGMSVLHAAEDNTPDRRRTIDSVRVLGEQRRLQSVDDHLRRPHTLDFLGGMLPTDLTNRVDFLTARAEVVSGRRGPWSLLRHRREYARYADGWTTTLADCARWARAWRRS